MAQGILAYASLSAAVDNTIYTAPAGVTATVAVSFCATGSATLIRLAILIGTDTTYIEYDTALGPAGSMGNSACYRAIVLDAGQKLKVRSSNAGCHVVVSGYEMPQGLAALDA